MNTALSNWENEGGAPISPNLERRSGPLYGTDSHIEWAERIRVRVDQAFDRIAASFRAVAGRQALGKRLQTQAIIAIIEEKRCEVLAILQAGTFIRDWQEIGDQVRRMILEDARYKAIRASHVTTAATVKQRCLWPTNPLTCHKPAGTNALRQRRRFRRAPGWSPRFSHAAAEPLPGIRLAHELLFKACDKPAIGPGIAVDAASRSIQPLS